jgi:N-dimethylarginine dimethylaminohydrolase
MGYRSMGSREAKLICGSLGESEFSKPPHLVVVHDPVRAGAFHQFDGVTDNGALQERFLFRERPNVAEFERQHAAFVATLRTLTTVVYTHEILSHDEMDDARENPNQVYTRDAVITLPWAPARYIASRMKAAIRRPEVSTMTRVARALGRTPLMTLPEDAILEGGDVIPFVGGGQRSLFIGYGRRTNWRAIEALRDALIPALLDRIYAIYLAEWRINLDGGMVPVSEDTVVAHLDSLINCRIVDAAGARDPVSVSSVFQKLGLSVIEVSKDASRFRQACNIFCAGDRRVVAYDMNPDVREALERRGIRTLLVPGSELVKGTGGPRCMTRPFYALGTT